MDLSDSPARKDSVALADRQRDPKARAVRESLLTQRGRGGKVNGEILLGYGRSTAISSLPQVQGSAQLGEEVQAARYESFILSAAAETIHRRGS